MIDDRPEDSPRLFWRLAFLSVFVGAVGVVYVLANAARIDAGAFATAPLPNRCDAPAAQGDRLVVTFTLRGQVIDVTCRQIKAVRS